MPKLSSKLRKKLFASSKKASASAETAMTASFDSSDEAWLEADNAKKGQKKPVIQKQVSVTTLVSGTAPHEDGPLLLHQHDNDKEQGGLSGLVVGGASKQRDDASLTTRRDSFSSIGSSYRNSNQECVLRFTEPDYYGQRHPIETPELIAAKMRSFENQLVLIPSHKKKCLKQAMTKCPELLTDKFKLMFLRCECFDEAKAAKRYAKYWDKRVEVFGPEKAFQPLTQHQALRDDALAMSQGLLTLSPKKDMSGRNIVYAVSTNQDVGAYPSLSMVRNAWYVFHAALEDEETQKKGLVFLADIRIVRLSLFDKDLARITAVSVAGCIPVRMSGIHGCQPPRIFFTIFPVIKVLFGERLRQRIRLHGGSSMDKVREGLTKYGMTESMLPVDLGGDLEICHKAWMQKRSLAGQ